MLELEENQVFTKQGKINCLSTELNLGITLKGGQSFRWFSHNDGYRGVFESCVWTLEQNGTHVYYTAQGPSVDTKNCDEILKRYFRLDVRLEDLCREWAESDPHFENSLNKTNGVRILNQDVVENVFSFICTSNNNIKRLFGEKICSIEGKDHYDFPTIEALAEESVEEKLKKEKFGYRAGYIAKTANKLMELGGKTWLSSLHRRNNVSYAMAREKLATLPGIGPKVADCVCLMSLGHLEAIPVDTHIFQVARVNYLPHLERQKTVTPRIHKQVGDHLRELWGPLAGWAQAIVFCAKINASAESSVKIAGTPTSSNCKRSKTDR
ncbi:N-glycosylase/DNA lyase isoform X2 [Ceratina calcarata]|uniref:N-glycosylase/DNA lyase n=1 Tax=Ceratina calcarata TaxID=156304 RepID=A0AAJ7SA53_9HYME|nr:N-glycosylase/DNA lyase isoform X2 [Ceratina calcarata]